MDINSIADSISEDDAIELHYRMARRFGWAGLLYVRGDAACLWNDEETISDSEWEVVRSRRSWHRMGEWLGEEAYGCARDAVADAKRFLSETAGA